MLATIATTGYNAVAAEKALAVALDDQLIAERELIENIQEKIALELPREEIIKGELERTDDLIRQFEKLAQTKEQKVCIQEKKSNCLKNDKVTKKGRAIKDNLKFKGQGLHCMYKAAKDCDINIDPKKDKEINSKMALLEKYEELMALNGKMALELADTTKMYQECTVKVDKISAELKEEMEAKIAEITKAYDEKLAIATKEAAAKIESLKVQIEDSNLKLEKTRAELAETQKALEVALKEGDTSLVENYKKQIEELQREIDALKSALEVLSSELSKAV
ncbi:MAG: hypothetical protein WC137_02425 [Alphaproteobacteria bacterium]